MKNILVNTYKSNLFGEDGATVIEYTLDGRKMNEAEMHFVIKEGGHASVSLASGLQTGMVHLVKDFLLVYNPQTLVNQVHRESEMKAMYQAGLRLHVKKDHNKRYNLKESLALLAEKRSLMMELA